MAKKLHILLPGNSRIPGSPDDDCYGEQEREGDEKPCVSEPWTVVAFMGTHSFAMAGVGNFMSCRRLSGSLIIRTQTGNRRIKARDLVAGAATVNLVSQAFGVLNHATATFY